MAKILMISFFVVIATSIVSAQLGILTCDSLILSGMRDCLTKFAPTRDSNPCCAYRKYRACSAGLRSGLKVAGKQAGCTNSLLAQAHLNSLSDRLTGVPLSSCKDAKKICRKSSSKPKRKPTSKVASSQPSLLGDSSSFLPSGRGGNSGNPLAFVQDSISSAVDSSRSLLSGGLGNLGGGGGGGSPFSSSRRTRPSILGNSSPLDSVFRGSGLPIGGGLL
uniref:Uncharacterized protein LOC113793562 n=1 Tax=Dermatophagoides pteronyssinus TaxID=6956 RepID=A0A6P6Y2W5_DERPT|nr:uncharacterized protein LOC113793562 [Dermatophagoides pteronyssinus]